MNIRQLDDSFGRSVVEAARRSDWSYLLICSIDGSWKFHWLVKILTYMHDCNEYVIPGVPIVKGIGNYDFDDESWFPNMSAVALLAELPEKLESIPAAYAAYRAFVERALGGEAREGYPLQPQDLDRWLVDSNVVELIAWSELVVSITPSEA